MATEDEFTDDEEFAEDGGDDVEIDEIDDIDAIDSDDEDVDDVDEVADVDVVDDDATDDDEDDDDKDEAEEAVEEEEEEEDDDEVDEEEEEESLDVLLTREKVLDDDEVSRSRGSSTSVSIDAGEFTCRSCFLVKRRAQLADEDQLICLDCA